MSSSSPILPFARPPATSAKGTGTSNMYSWEIMVFRFVTGEFAISRAYYSHQDKSWSLFRPMTFVPNNQGGVGLTPFIPEFITDEKMIVPEKNLFCEPMTPVKPLKDVYLQATSNIVPASSLGGDMAAILRKPVAE